MENTHVVLPQHEVALPIRQHRGRGKKLSLEEERMRANIVIRMKKHHATLVEIGTKLHCTRERARQIVDEITAAHGSTVFTCEEMLWRVREVAAELGLTHGAVRTLVKQREFLGIRFDEDIQDFLFTRAGIEALKEYRAHAKQRTCTICSQPFEVSGPKVHKLTCSPQCAEKRKRAHPGEVSAEWRKEASICLREHVLPVAEVWILMTEAVRMSELTHMQIRHFQSQRVIHTRAHPTLRRRGQPVTTYAKSELEILRRVWQKYCSKN